MTEATLHVRTHCPGIVLDSSLMGGPVTPTSLVSLLPMWENAALGKSPGTAGWEPLLGRRAVLWLMCFFL